MAWRWGSPHWIPRVVCQVRRGLEQERAAGVALGGVRMGRKQRQGDHERLAVVLIVLARVGPFFFQLPAGLEELIV